MKIAPQAKVAIVGSRDFEELSLVHDFVAKLPPDCTVISGGARGVDRVAAVAAKMRGLRLIEHPADWSKGRGAGFARNTLIAQECDLMVAFWDGGSRGTAHAMQEAARFGRPVHVIRVGAGAVPAGDAEGGKA